MSYSTIGNADGPTSIFFAGKLGWGPVNEFNLIIIVLILLPNIIYAIKFRGTKNQCRNKMANVIEQISRYLSMLFMIISFEGDGLGFSSKEAFVIYAFGNAVLLLVYWIVWILYFRKQRLVKSMILAVVPTLIFLLCGITLNSILLIASSIIFGIAHSYVTYQNAKFKKINKENIKAKNG